MPHELNFRELNNNFVDFDNASWALLFQNFYVLVSFVYIVCILWNIFHTDFLDSDNLDLYSILGFVKELSYSLWECVHIYSWYLLTLWGSKVRYFVWASFTAAVSLLLGCHRKRCYLYSKRCSALTDSSGRCGNFYASLLLLKVMAHTLHHFEVVYSATCEVRGGAVGVTHFLLRATSVRLPSCHHSGKRTAVASCGMV